MKNRIFVFALFLISGIYIILSCEESPTENNYYISYDPSPLTNPDSLIRVISTNPQNNTIGPFGTIDPTIPPLMPRINIQFNKLINIADINDKNITLKSGNERIDLNLSSDNYNNTYPYNLRDILVFQLFEWYLADKTYTLTIDTTLLDIHGYHLEKNYTISFVPEPFFRVSYIWPSENSVQTEHFNEGYANFYILFNSPVDSSIFKSISISPNIQGYWYVNSDSVSISYFHEEELTFETQYSIKIDANAQDANGLKIKNSFRHSFTTAPFSVYISSAAYNNNELRFINFEFNGAVDTSSVRSSIKINPKLDYRLEISEQDGIYKELKFSFENSIFEPNTRYQLILDETIKSESGYYLKEPYIFTYRTYP